MNDHIPLYHEVVSQLSHFLIENKSLSVLLIDLSDLKFLKKWYGKKIYHQMEKFILKTINDMEVGIIRDEDILAQNYPVKEEFLIFLSPKRDGERIYNSDLDKMERRIHKILNSELMKEFKNIIRDPKIYMGYAVTLENSLYSYDEQIEKLIKEAGKMAACHRFLRSVKHKEKIHEFILNDKIATVYQPVVDIKTFSIIGYEAFSRGPKKTEYERPHSLFECIDCGELIVELDRLCRRHAFERISKLKQIGKLFVNCIPRKIFDHNLRNTYLDEIVEEIKSVSGNIILELTEDEALESYDVIREIFMYYTTLGLAIKIDSTGAGFGSFEAIAELKPEYIKLDITMIREVHDHPIKQEVIKAILKISEIIHTKVIAEGVETRQEHETLKELGIQYGQGFFYARPDYPFPEVNKNECLVKCLAK